MLFIGDSNTAGSWSYADKIMKHCSAIGSKKIAKSSMKTTWMLDQLRSELGKNQYDLVAILGGSNDIFGTGSISKAKESMNEMLRIIEETGAQSVVINPPSKKFHSSTTDKQWKLIRDWTQFLRTHKSPYTFIDFESLTQDRSVFAGDNIHINSSGHQLLADEFISKLRLS